MPLGISTWIAIGASVLATGLGVEVVRLRRRVRGLRRRSGRARRQLLARLGLSAGDLPPETSWSADDALLGWLADEIGARRPAAAVDLGSGLSTVVMAKCFADAGAGHVHALEHDAAYAEATRGRIAALGLGAHATVIDAPLEEWGREGRWYARSALAGLPGEIGLLVIDGPPVTSGRVPRYPAGPELFARIPPGGAAVLDDGGRGKEQAALIRFAAEFPEFRQERLATAKGAVLLRREDD